MTPDDAPRTGKAACDGAVFPVGYGLDASGALLGPAACPEPARGSRRGSGRRGSC